jgi:putative transposase
MSKSEKSMDGLGTSQLWAEFRFSVIGALLSCPPKRGQLNKQLEELSQKSWKHPVTEEPFKISIPTIERWYYAALKEKGSPMPALSRKVRSDIGQSKAVTEDIKVELEKLFNGHKSWSYQLQNDNLAVVVEQKKLGKSPSYSTVRRFLVGRGLVKQKKSRNYQREGFKKSQLQKQQRETRSYENPYVGGLWHLDFHHCSREVITSQGELVRPTVLGIIDDRSRLLCHIQWYFGEGTENLVHGFIQALQKRGMPRSLLTDNGKPMLSTEFTSGLKRLGISHKTTLPYSPEQNGKQETIWSVVEGRLMAMLENKKDLTLKFLNDATIAWAEADYNKANHDEIKTTPLRRFLDDQSVLRESPSSELLKNAFCRQERRKLRKSDTSISIQGIRFDIPSQYKHLVNIYVRYACWDLRSVHLFNNVTNKLMEKIYPTDKAKHGEGRRKVISASQSEPSQTDEVAPLLLKILAEVAETGLPPAYQPKED